MKSFISNVILLEECKQVLDLDINISYVYDVDSQQVICMNKSASQFFGVTNEDLADIHNRFIAKYVHPEDFTLLQGYRTYLDSISGGKFNLIIKYKRHDGEYKWMYANAKPVVFMRMAMCVVCRLVVLTWKRHYSIRKKSLYPKIRLKVAGCFSSRICTAR